MWALTFDEQSAHHSRAVIVPQHDPSRRAQLEELSTAALAIKRRIASAFGHLKRSAVLDDTAYRLLLGQLQLHQNTGELGFFERFGVCHLHELRDSDDVEVINTPRADVATMNLCFMHLMRIPCII